MHRILILSACVAALAFDVAAQTKPGMPVEAQPIMPTVVYFDPMGGELTGPATSALNVFRRTYESRGGGGSIIIAGHTARAGDAAANVGLSQQRANAVRDYLMALGVPAGVMTTQAFGETRNAIDTADGLREPLNDRVEVTVGPGSGW